MSEHTGLLLATGVSDSQLSHNQRTYSVNCCVNGTRVYNADEIPTGWITRFSDMNSKTFAEAKFPGNRLRKRIIETKLGLKTAKNKRESLSQVSTRPLKKSTVGDHSASQPAGLATWLTQEEAAEEASLSRDTSLGAGDPRSADAVAQGTITFEKGKLEIRKKCVALHKSIDDLTRLVSAKPTLSALALDLLTMKGRLQRLEKIKRRKISGNDRSLTELAKITSAFGTLRDRAKKGGI
jgi:hypothetical protein